MYPTTVFESDPIVLEMQGFRDNMGKFIVKEVGLIAVRGMYQEVITFLPPFHKKTLKHTTQKTNSWLTKYFHKIQWEQGQHAYDELEAILKNRTARYGQVLTKGSENAKFLTDLLNREVQDLDKILLSSLARLKDIDYICFHDGECALKNAIKIRNWLWTVIITISNN